MRFKDLTGKRFGRLLVIGVDHRRISSGRQVPYFKCQCDCGGVKVILGYSLSCGKTNSCGCVMKEETIKRSTKHGYANRNNLSPEYKSWAAAKGRCTSESNNGFQNYGGRGIKMCQEWIDDFQAFLSDMGTRPPRTSLDRIDNNKGYSPDNCRWATRKEQNNNQRSNIILTHEGRSQGLSKWADELGIPRKVIYDRLFRYQWSVQRALTNPIRK